MAVVTQLNNGSSPTEAMSDLVAQAREGGKVAVDNVLETFNIYNERGTLYLDAQQKLMQSNLDMCQKYSQAYGDFVLKAYQYAIDQSLVWRRQFDEMSEAYYTKSQALGVSEQQSFIDAIGAFQVQAKANTERVAEMFTPPN